jgi:hypothetical protein
MARYYLKGVPAAAKNIVDRGLRYDILAVHKPGLDHTSS